MIDNAEWQAILSTATDISTVVEIYSSDAVPGDTGFDPNDALVCYAAIEGISYMGVDYTRLIRSIGSIKRTIAKQSNTASVTFDNTDRTISRFEFNTSFEGLVMVIRAISRSSSDTLGKSQILFAGRCDKPTSGSKESLTVSATWVLGGPEVQIPYRKFTPDDQAGRPSTDPEFEGFINMPQSGVVAYSEREKRSGLLGLLGFKKTVSKTLPWSSYSDLDANKVVPEVFGAMQIMFVHIGYADVGTYIEMREAVAQGPILDMQNVRSLDPRLPLDGTSFAKSYGLVGAANGDDPAWVAPGYYSRTAIIRCQADFSLVSETDAAPDVVGIVFGRLMTIPDVSGDWTDDDEWTANGAAHVRFCLTSPDYLKLDTSWLDGGDFTDSYDFCAEYIVQQTASDLMLLVAG